jgi:hypothetical protein
MRDSSKVNDCWEKKDETGDSWILPKDIYEFMRKAQKIKAVPNASAFINSRDLAVRVFGV